MRDGIYEVSFSQGTTHRIDYGYGIVTIKDGAINGGDTGYIYAGKLTYAGNRVTGLIRVNKWSQAVPSVFPGLDHYDLNVALDFHDDALDGQGTIVGRDGTLTVSAHRIGDAA